VADLRGKFNASVAGEYTFQTRSDDGSVLYIDGQPVLDNNRSQGQAVRTGTINLTAGLHDIVVGYYQGAGGGGFSVGVTLPGQGQSFTIGSELNLSNDLLSHGSNDLTIGSLSGSGSVVTAATGNFTTGIDNTNQTFSGIISGPGNVIKTGLGTQTLSGMNTYTGTTAVNGGVLEVAAAGSLSLASSITVNNGGTLNVKGTVGDVLVNAGGILNGDGVTGNVQLGAGAEIRPGNSPGILNTGSIATTGGVLGTGIYMEIGGLTAGTQHDQINTTGTVTLNGGTLVVSLINSFVPTKDDVFWIWLNDGSDLIGGTPGWLTNLPDGTLFPVTDTASTDDAWQIHYNQDGDGSGGPNDIKLTYIPEPSIAGLLMGFLSLIGLRRRRR
jgi:autotransporter-associated beta strand protein